MHAILAVVVLFEQRVTAEVLCTSHEMYSECHKHLSPSSSLPSAKYKNTPRCLDSVFGIRLPE
jgi:hypothetical protein